MEVYIWPLPFSPDGDGFNDELYIEIAAMGGGPVANWSFRISEPVYPHNAFYERSGEGDIPAMMVWDGIGTAGELVQSAMDYPITITIIDIYGEEVSRTYAIRIDVLVIDEGGVLRVIVPSIMFGPNLGTFAGLSEEVMENNDRVLRRIAEILNRFEEYDIVIEGHANPTTPPGTALRAEEETGSPRIPIGLQPLSEERARTVLEYLVTLGVERERLSSVGMGGSRILVEFEDRDYWWQNRRVEFILIR